MLDVRLNDANAILKKTRRMYAPDEIDSIDPIATACVTVDDIHRAHTIDAVPVVRCMDCMHCLWDELHKDKKGRCMEHHLWCEADGFCHKGEKMNGGASE